MINLEAFLDAADLLVDLVWCDRSMELGVMSVRATTSPQRITLSVPSTGEADYSDVIELAQGRWGPYRRLHVTPPDDEREPRSMLARLVENRRSDEAYWWQRGARVVALVHSTLEPGTGVLERFRKPVHGGHLWVLMLPADAVPFTAEDLARLRTTLTDRALMVQLALDEEYGAPVLSGPVAYSPWNIGWDRYLLDPEEYDEFSADLNAAETFLVECDEDDDHLDQVLAGSPRLKGDDSKAPRDPVALAESAEFGSAAARLAQGALARSGEFDAWLAAELGDRFAMTGHYAERHVVFVKTDAQRNELIDPDVDPVAVGGSARAEASTNERWETAYRRLLEPHDPFGALTGANAWTFEVSSRETLDRDYAGSIYNFWL